MFRPRVIPVLLLRGKGLVKSINFKNHRYIGDPINAVKIFNDQKADELVFLDILATKERRVIDLDFVRKVGEEANMPFAVGGGINGISQINDIISAGAEKVIINTAASTFPDFIESAVNHFGSSTISVCIDIKNSLFGKQQVWVYNGTKPTGLRPIEFAKTMAEKGVGEIIIQSIERDGTMKGYDLKLVSDISAEVTIPVVALGGAGNCQDLREGYHKGHASALAAASMFIYHGSRDGILINYPTQTDLRKVFDSNE